MTFVPAVCERRTSARAASRSGPSQAPALLTPMVYGQYARYPAYPGGTIWHVTRAASVPPTARTTSRRSIASLRARRASRRLNGGDAHVEEQVRQPRLSASVCSWLAWWIVSCGAGELRAARCSRPARAARHVPRAAAGTSSRQRIRSGYPSGRPSRGWNCWFRTSTIRCPGTRRRSCTARSRAARGDPGPASPPGGGRRTAAVRRRRKDGLRRARWNVTMPLRSSVTIASRRSHCRGRATQLLLADEPEPEVRQVRQQRAAALGLRRRW